MKIATIKQLKETLNHNSHSDLVDLCLHLSRFKKENKELLSYILFQSADQANFIKSVAQEIFEQFSQINTSSYYYIKKSVRKILKRIKTYIRYSKQKETEIELLLYFCTQLKTMQPAMTQNASLIAIYERQILHIKKVISSLHEDLQYDYNLQINTLLAQKKH